MSETPAPAPAPNPFEEEDVSIERWLRRLAPPITLIAAFLVARTGVLASLVHIFDTMWLHEIGHAVTAWLSGFAAFPGPWRTSIADTRSPLLSIVLGAALVGCAVWSYRAGRRRAATLAGVVFGVLLFLTLAVHPHTAQGFILFGGDAGPLVLGTVLVLTFFAARGSYLQVSWLRWGFLVLGAFGFADTFTLWFSARKNPGVIPFGDIEGVGHSDPTRLVDEHGWDIMAMVHRYVALGVACLVVMAVVYVVYGLNPGAARSSDRRASL